MQFAIISGCFLFLNQGLAFEESSGLESNILDNIDDDQVWKNTDMSTTTPINNVESEDLLTLSTELCTDSSLSKEQRDLILNTHNELRSQLAFGMVKNKEGMLKPGRNIYKLFWDCKLESKVQRWIRNCSTKFMPSKVLHSYSQIVKMFWPVYEGTNHTLNILNAMFSWWSQVRTTGNNDDKNRYFGNRHYYGWANMAKGKSTRMACSYQICEAQQKAIISCLYNVKAQSEREMIYEPGRPCCLDEDCFTYPRSKCLASEGLCLAPYRQKDNGVSNMCNWKTTMSDATRIAALDQHNFYRLARGFAWNGETNSTQPGALRMLKMEYDCELERYAYEWAERCIFAHSNSWDRPNQGQNLYMTTFAHFDPQSILHTAIEKWWQELEEFGIPADNILSGDVWAKKGKLIGHYTQMAWSRTYRLGCAVVSCPSMGFVVCHYAPPGNRKGHVVYEIGSHCMENEHCPNNSVCMREDGLCAVVR